MNYYNFTQYDITEITDFLDTPSRDNTKLRCFNPSINTKRPMTIAAWINGTLVMKDPFTTNYYYYVLSKLENLAKLKISKDDIVKVDGTVTGRKVDLAGFMAALR